MRKYDYVDNGPRRGGRAYHVRMYSHDVLVLVLSRV